MRVVVTGSRGFVGPWLLSELRSGGDEALELPEEADVTVAASIGEALGALVPDAVVHLAAQSSVSRSWQDPEGTFLVNALGTLNLCRAAARMDRPPRVLLVSSSEVYGRVSADDLPVSEDQSLAPTTPYAASKAAAEMIALQAWLGQGLPVVRARAFNHTGPGQPLGFVVPDLATQVMKAARGELDRVTTGNLEVSRDITDVRDVVRAYRLLLRKGEPGQVYNVCRGQAVVLSDVLAVLMRLAGTDVPVWADPARSRPAEVPVQMGDAGRIKALCGWAPTFSVEDTLRDLLASLAQV